MSKKNLKDACIFVHVPEKDGGYKRHLLTLEELSELMPCCTPVEDPAPAPEAEAAPKKPAKKKKKKKE
jgi:hypothetical protein